MTRAFIYPVATFAWVTNIVIARLLSQRWHFSVPAVALLAYVGVMSAAHVIGRRRRGRWWRHALSYSLWLPLAYLTFFYDHHSLVPRWPLLWALASCAAWDAAGGRVGRPFLAAASLLACLNLVDCAWPRATPAVILEKHPARYWEADTLLGYRPLPETTVTITCWHQGQRVYSVRCAFDQFRRRRTPGARDERPPAHAIFMGNSCVFGENVADDETLPAHFAKETTGFATYNYGFIGWGPQQMLALLQSGRVAAQVPQSEGVLLYGFLPDHVRRVNGSYTTTAWGVRFPRYVLRQGVIEDHGPFISSQPRRMALFALLRSSPTLDRAARLVDGKWGTRPARWATLLAVLRRCDYEYRRQFGGRFITFIWPFRDPHTTSMADSLRAHGLEVLDLAARGLTPPTPEQQVPFDPHPSGAYYALIARELSAAIAPLHASNAVSPEDRVSESAHHP